MEKKASGSKLRKKLDGFWAALFLTPDGRPKSAMLLYAFCLSILFVLLYGASYFFLIDVVERLFAGASVGVRNLMEALLPGIVGSAVCGSTFFLQRKDKRIIPVAYLWLWLYAVVVLITMALFGDAENFRIFLYFFTLLVPAGLLSGSAYVFLLYRRHRRAERAKGLLQGEHAAR